MIRDLDLALPRGATVLVQKVTWLDPVRNRFRTGSAFTARVRESSYHRYELDPEDFARFGARASEFDPMGSTSFRVVLIRPSDERWIFRILTISLVVLFVLADVLAVWPIIRRAGVPVDVDVAAGL